MQFYFKSIHHTDLPEVLTIFKSAAENIAKMNIDHWQYWKNPPQQKTNWLKEGIKNKEYYFIDAEDGDRIGMVRIQDADELYWGKNNDKALYVHSLVVLEKFNGRKYGNQILQQIEKSAKKKNKDYIRLDCDSKNSKLCRYYEKQSFQKVGEQKLPLSTYNLYQKDLRPLLK